VSQQKTSLKQITIIGLGLIGGSLALAIKQHFPSIHITGVDKRRVLKRALERNAIDNAESSIKRSVLNADLIFIATPISVITRVIPVVAAHAPSHAIITDTGSVKRSIKAEAGKYFPQGNFIGGHPMAGSELSGIDAAHPLLFQNAYYILTPIKGVKKKSIQLLANFLNALDARVYTMDAITHDSVVAAVSHLPQLAAVALMNTVGKHHPNAPRHLALSAGGFRDMTRIASSPFDVWKDILSSNRKEVRDALYLYIKQLNKIAAFAGVNNSALENQFRLSRKLRSRIPRTMKGFLIPLVEFSVFIEDKPGELARLTTALANEAINIKDLELLKVREGRGGTFRLSFENRTIALTAADVLQKEGFNISTNW